MKTRSFLIYAIVVSLLEQGALLLVLLVILPSLGLAVPPWGVAAAAAALAITSVILTRLNLQAIGLRPSRSPDVGICARVVRTLNPHGYVRVGNELWPAVSEAGTVEAGAAVRVTRMDGLRLVVELIDEVANE
jgi:membrane protein implicated in regulation of membrane protease activity